MKRIISRGVVTATSSMVFFAALSIPHLESARALDGGTLYISPFHE